MVYVIFHFVDDNLISSDLLFVFVYTIMVLNSEHVPNSRIRGEERERGCANISFSCGFFNVPIIHLITRCCLPLACSSVETMYIPVQQLIFQF